MALTSGCISTATVSAQNPPWRKLAPGQTAILNAQTIACDSFADFLTRYKGTNESRGCRRTTMSSTVTIESLHSWQMVASTPIYAVLVESQSGGAIEYVPEGQLVPVVPPGTHLCVALFDDARRELTLTNATLVRIELPTKQNKLTITVEPTLASHPTRIPILWAFFDGYTISDFVPHRLPPQTFGLPTDLYACKGTVQVDPYFHYRT
jgi:hypothetical protein